MIWVYVSTIEPRDCHDKELLSGMMLAEDVTDSLVDGPPVYLMTVLRVQ
jgi:hypothetical protein